MSILDKPLDAITVHDLAALVEAEARETGELEFKGTLPAKSGQDTWITGGCQGIGDHARNQILAEMVAFANADGGTLVLGLHETKDEPRRAAKLEALPNCEMLARRLEDAAQDIIEPRLSLVAKAIRSDEDGNGYVVLRVSKSVHGPHRLTTTRDFYARRGERTAKMTAREIQDLTLNIARTAEGIERLFEERASVSRDQLLSLHDLATTTEGRPYTIRATAVPLQLIQIPNITRNKNLWWLGEELPLSIDGNRVEYAYPAREYYASPRVRLRGFEQLGGAVERLLTSDGLIEFKLVRQGNQALSTMSDGVQSVYANWILGIAIGAIAQVNHLRTRLAWDGVDFGLEFEIFCKSPFAMMWAVGDYKYLFNGGASCAPLRFPRYLIGQHQDDLDNAVRELTRDLCNACGLEWDGICKVHWAG